MKTMKMKKRNLVTMIMLFCGLCVMVHAQENFWAKQRSQHYKRELGLTDEQTDKVYDELAAHAKRAKAIRENTVGDEQKKALRQNRKVHEENLFEILIHSRSML